MDLDMKTLVHVGTELLIITGLGVWMNGRIKGIEAGFSVMDKNIKELQEIINKQNQIIMAHDQFLKHLAGGMPGISSGPKGGNPPPLGKSNTGSSAVETKDEKPDSASESDQGSPHVEKKNRKKDRTKKEIKELTQEDIDQIIQAELRNELNQNEEIEVETNTNVERDRSFKHKKKDK